MTKQTPTYKELVDFARWTQTFWKNGIDIMRRNHLAIRSDTPMEKLAFTFYSNLCEIDSKASHLFEEGYGDKNYKNEKVILVDLTKYPSEQEIQQNTTKQMLNSIEQLRNGILAELETGYIESGKVNAKIINRCFDKFIAEKGDK